MPNAEHPPTVGWPFLSVAPNIAVMEMTPIEIEMVEQFPQTLPPSEVGVDFFLALGFFRASGLDEGTAHRLAEYVSALPADIR